MAPAKNRYYYLKDVRPRQNRQWSKKEKASIFTLRQKGISCSIIANVFDASLNQIHNVTRYEKNEKLKKCRLCGDPLIPEDREPNGKRKICPKCFKKVQANKRKLRRARLIMGLCEYCGEHKALTGHTGCKLCISATHRRRYTENLCGACGKRPIRRGGMALCSHCAQEMREKRKTERSELKLGGTDASH